MKDDKIIDLEPHQYSVIEPQKRIPLDEVIFKIIWAAIVIVGVRYFFHH